MSDCGLPNCFVDEPHSHDRTDAHEKAKEIADNFYNSLTYSETEGSEGQEAVDRLTALIVDALEAERKAGWNEGYEEASRNAIKLDERKAASIDSEAYLRGLEEAVKIAEIPLAPTDYEKRYSKAIAEQIRKQGQK